MVEPSNKDETQSVIDPQSIPQDQFDDNDEESKANLQPADDDDNLDNSQRQLLSADNGSSEQKGVSLPPITDQGPTSKVMFHPQEDILKEPDEEALKALNEEESAT